MRSAFVLVPLLVLAACATPREACISSATRDLNVVNDLIATTRGNLRRGYGIEERQEVRVVRDICSVTDEDGNETDFRCDTTETFTRREPIALDLRAEQDKLDQLVEQKRRLTRESNAAIEQCIAIHPE